MKTVHRTMGTAALTLGFALTAGGCLIASGNKVSESGVRVSEQTFGQIEVGTTSESWIIATLGEPSDTRIVSDAGPAVKILTYEYIVERKSGSAVFLILAASSESKRIHRTKIELTDGIVTRCWVESSTI